MSWPGGCIASCQPWGVRYSPSPFPIMPELENPFQETLLQRHRAEPCTVVIFGATGDLTNRKLIPALYNVAAEGDLPPQFKVVGFARRDKSDEVFRTELEEGNRKTAAAATTTNCGPAFPKASTITAVNSVIWRDTKPWPSC